MEVWKGKGDGMDKFSEKLERVKGRKERLVMEKRVLGG